MTTATDKQLLDALERAIIGISSGLAQIPEGGEGRAELKNTLEEMFDRWRDLNDKVNPCDIKLND